MDRYPAGAPETKPLGSVPFSTTNSNAVAGTANLSQDHLRPGSRPSGNNSSASGKNKLIDHGQEYTPTVVIARTSPTGHRCARPNTVTGPAAAARACPS